MNQNIQLTTETSVIWVIWFIIRNLQFKLITKKGTLT